MPGAHAVDESHLHGTDGVGFGDGGEPEFSLRGGVGSGDFDCADDYVDGFRQQKKRRRSPSATGDPHFTDAVKWLSKC